MANNALTVVRVIGVGVLFFNGTPVEKTMTTNEQQTMSTLLSSFNFLHLISFKSCVELDNCGAHEQFFFKPIISQFCIGDGQFDCTCATGSSVKLIHFCHLNVSSPSKVVFEFDCCGAQKDFAF